VRPFPPPAPAGCGSPVSTVLRAHYDCLPSVRRSFGSLRPAVTCHSTAASLPIRRAVQRRGWVTLVRRFHPISPALVSVETAGSPRFLGNPLVLPPCSRTPPGRTRQAVCGACARPGLVQRSGLPGGCRSRGSIARHRHSLSTLPRSDCSRRARLASGGWPASAGWDSLTHRVALKGPPQVVHSSGLLLSQALPGAMDRRLQRTASTELTCARRQTPFWTTPRQRVLYTLAANQLGSA